MVSCCAVAVLVACEKVSIDVILADFHFKEFYALYL